MIDVRRLRPADVEAMTALNRVFGQVFADAVYAAKPPSADYMRGLLAKDSFVALAAYADGELVGGLAGYELPKFEQERSEFYIYDLAVREDCRRRGIATALIDAFRSIAAQNNGWVVFVQADHGDRPAIALYTKLGTREDVLHFDIDVG